MVQVRRMLLPIIPGATARKVFLEQETAPIRTPLSRKLPQSETGFTEIKLSCTETETAPAVNQHPNPGIITACCSEAPGPPGSRIRCPGILVTSSKVSGEGQQLFSRPGRSFFTIEVRTAVFHALMICKFPVRSNVIRKPPGGKAPQNSILKLQKFRFLENSPITVPGPAEEGTG